MVTTTVVMNGHLIVEGVKFLWWVTDGYPARLTVSHPIHGTKTAAADLEPVSQARELARTLLHEDDGSLGV